MNKKNFAPIGIRTIKYYPSHTNSNCIVTLLTGVATFYLFDTATDIKYVKDADRVYNKFLKSLNKKKIYYEIEDKLYE